MSRYDRLAVILSLFAIAITTWIGSRVFENLPHIEDEIAYVWQAETIAYAGKLELASPPCPTCFLVPFVVDFHGVRFGKYPPAWPVVLAAGIRLGLRNLVNPLLAGLGIWLTYRLGKKLLGARIGVLAALLTLVSPFFLMNSSSLLSHPLALDLSLIFTLSWMDTLWPARDAKTALETASLLRRNAPRWMTALTGGLTLGILALTRPLTAVGVGLPFAIHGLVLLWRGPTPVRRLVLLSGGVALATGLLFFVWQYALTGNALLDPYTLWWPYDRIGFGPGIGLAPGGNNLPYILTNIYTSLKTGASDLFGWGMFSWIFLPFGIWAIRRERRSWLAASVFPSLVLVYTLYWIGSWLLGPRYYYEGLYSPVILSAAGIAWLAGISFNAAETTVGGIRQGVFRLSISKPDFGVFRRMARPLAVVTLVTVLAAASVVYYDPLRIGGLHGLYGVSQEAITAFLTSQEGENTPELVIVHTSSQTWIGYGALIDLETSMLDTPYIFIIDCGPVLNQVAINAFPGRKVVNYYP